MENVLKYYGLFAEGDFETMERECFDPDVTWIMPGHLLCREPTRVQQRQSPF